MLRPPYLVKGDKIAIVAPARSITFEEVHPSIRLFQKWGWETVLGTHIFKKDNQFAGTDDQRLADLQQMLDDAAVRALICARGGYGTVRLIDSLDFSRFLDHPKWIVGYSDITVLHSHIHRHFGLETLHAVMPVNILTEEARSDTLETMRNALEGTNIRYSFPRSRFSREGQSEGILVGGNLSILYSLMGSSSQIDTTGKILFLEDVDEYLYHIDRMMMCLKRAGMLRNLGGLIIGGMDRMNDNEVPFGKTANEIISDAVKEFHYPVCSGFPAGHGDQNLALILGRKVRLSVGKEVDLTFI
jgi:muramoyltetrapeptide carboxypeptidase